MTPVIKGTGKLRINLRFNCGGGGFSRLNGCGCATRFLERSAPNVTDTSSADVLNGVEDMPANSGCTQYGFCLIFLQKYLFKCKVIRDYRKGFLWFFRARSSAVEQWTHNPLVQGSNPCGPSGFLVVEATLPENDEILRCPPRFCLRIKLRRTSRSRLRFRMAPVVFSRAIYIFTYKVQMHPVRLSD